MTQTRRTPGVASRGSTKVTTTTSSHPTHAADIYAWTAIFLNDGRVVSLAWLCGWRGAITGRWS